MARCQELNTQINGLDAELQWSLPGSGDRIGLAIPGCGVLSAAVIIGETAGVHRFSSRARFARFTGTAPVPVWSGASAGKVRLNRGGNRDMNCALHTIAITQARQGVGPGSSYIAKQTERGKDTTAALRLRGGSLLRTPCSPACPNRPTTSSFASHDPRRGSLTT